MRVAGQGDRAAQCGLVEAIEFDVADAHLHGAAGRGGGAGVGQALFDQEGFDLVARAVEFGFAHRVELKGAGRRIRQYGDRCLTAGLIDRRVGVVREGFEDREVQRRGQQQAEHQHWFTADLVRQPAEKDEERRADHHADDQQGVGHRRIHFQELGQEEQHVKLRGVKGHRLPGVDAEQGDQHDFEVFPFAEGFADRRFRGFAFLFHFQIRRRLVQAQADPGGNAQQHDRQQERNTPAPHLKLIAGEVAATEHHQQRQQQAESGGRLNPAGVETAFADWRVFCHISRSTAVFTAEGQALKHAQHHQNDRRGDADAGVGRQQPDAERRQAHEDDGGEEGVLAPDHVPQPPEHQRAERPDDEAGGEGHQRKDERRGVVDPGEKLLADHRREGAIEEEVIPLEHRTE
ncbi:hypothetical protein D3C87_797150 [compost metagenome]